MEGKVFVNTAKFGVIAWIAKGAPSAATKRRKPIVSCVAGAACARMVYEEVLVCRVAAAAFANTAKCAATVSSAVAATFASVE